MLRMSANWNLDKCQNLNADRVGYNVWVKPIVLDSSFRVPLFHVQRQVSQVQTESEIKNATVSKMVHLKKSFYHSHFDKCNNFGVMKVLHFKITQALSSFPTEQIGDHHDVQGGLFVRQEFQQVVLLNCILKS